MLKPQHCTWYERKQNPKWVHLQYFILLYTVWQLGRQAGPQPQVLFYGDSEYWPKPKTRTVVYHHLGRRGKKDKGRRVEKKITDRRQVTVYIQVRPTFYQSKTIHSICMQKLWGWMHLKAESDLSALLREIHTGEATGKLWDWVKTRRYKWRPYQRAAILVSLLQAWFFLFFYFFKHQCFEHRDFFLG